MKARTLTGLSFALLCAAGLVLAQAAAGADVYVKEADNFVILFDTSNTMNEVDPATGKKKVTMAKEALLEMNREIPDLGFNAGLYTFTPWEAFVEVGPYDRRQFEQAIQELGTRNTHIVQNPTPLGHGMDNLGPLLNKVGGRTVVFLFSDGQNTDELNPVAEAHRLDDMHDVCFLIISYADEDEPVHRNLLQEIAAVNDCSRIIDFAEFVAQPGLCTGALCTTPAQVVVAAPGDDDGDGVSNDQDICPGTPEGYAVNDVGCMIPVIMEERFVHFQFDESFIEDKFHDEINAFARFMAEHPEAKLILAGHTDSIGTEAYNMGLSRRRVMSVHDYIVKNFDIDPSKIEKNWYGEAYPIAKNETAFGRRQNRRVEMLVRGAYQR